MINQLTDLFVEKIKKLYIKFKLLRLNFQKIFILFNKSLKGINIIKSN